jgi:VIT1/CCC1 family predicted Fe2+/Mn2+ transporter
VSVAGIVIGVAGATSARGPIFTAGLAGLVAGAVSMALGEYVSVSSQRDSERAELKQEKGALAASPVQAAAASALAFTSGALLPVLAILLPPAALRVPVTFTAVLIALGLAGALSARIGGSPIRRAVLRVVIGGALGLAFTYGIGHLFGTAIG